MAKRRNIAVVLLALALCAGAGAAMGCNSQEKSDAGSLATASHDEQYAQAYPLQYGSLYQTRVNSNGVEVGHSVQNVRDTCEAPTVRDRNGDPVLDAQGNVQMIGESYDEETETYSIDRVSDRTLSQMNLKSGCVSCKSTRFEEIYEQQGAAAFDSPYNAEARAIVDGDYFDCAMCHDGEPSARSLRPGLMYFQVLGDGLADRLDERNGVCAQCHNSYDYRSSIRTEDDLRTVKAYRNGYDVDSLFETCWEDGVNFDVDEDTGIAQSCLVHPTIELYMDTNMHLLGVTCVDCHMPKAVGEGGVEYTSHFAANSPLESEESLEYCLNCHGQQGIASTAQMAGFVRDREGELASGIAALEERRLQFRSVLEQAVAQQPEGVDLDGAKKLYAKVTWYECCLRTGPAESPGSQAAMLDWEGILDKANDACDEGLMLLG